MNERWQFPPPKDSARKLRRAGPLPTWFWWVFGADAGLAFLLLLLMLNTRQPSSRASLRYVPAQGNRTRS